MLNINQSKLSRQLEGCKKFTAAGGRGIMVYPPGFGKTYSAVIAAFNILRGIENKDSSLLILVPTLGVADVWDNFLRSVDFAGEDCHFKYHILSVNKIKDLDEVFSDAPNCKMVIVDEYHKFTTDLRINILNYVVKRIGYVLGLTGTLPDNSVVLRNVPLHVIDRISEPEAIANKWISNFVEYNIKLELSDFDKQRYEKFSIPIQELQELFRGCAHMLNLGSPIFKSDVDVMYSCIYGKTFYNKTEPIFIRADAIIMSIATRKGWKRDLLLTDDYNRMLNDFWSPAAIKDNVHTFNKLVRERNEILTINPVKRNAILELYNSNIVPTLIFNESTDFADSIATAIGEDAFAYHSNISSKPMIDPSTGEHYTYKSGIKKGELKLFGKTTLRKYAIDGIKSGKFKALVTARALDEGVDIPNLERVITSAGTINPLTYAQRSGRGKRIDYSNPNKVTRIYNLYFDDFTTTNGNVIISRDKQKLIQRQAGSNDVIWIDCIQDLV